MGIAPRDPIFPRLHVPQASTQAPHARTPSGGIRAVCTTPPSPLTCMYVTYRIVPRLSFPPSRVVPPFPTETPFVAHRSHVHTHVRHSPSTPTHTHTHTQRESMRSNTETVVTLKK